MVVRGINQNLKIVVQMKVKKDHMQTKLKLGFIVCLIFSFYRMDAQIPEGMISYNRKTDWVSINAKLPYVSSEEADRRRLTSGGWENKGRDYELSFKDNKSVYLRKEEESSSGYSWRKSKFILIRDYNKNTIKDLREDAGVDMLIEDDMKKYKWKILNEIKGI